MIVRACTCGVRAPAFHVLDDGTVEARPTYAIDCPDHGLDALLAHTTTQLDIEAEEST